MWNTNLDMHFLTYSSLTFIAKLLESTTCLHCLQFLSFHFYFNPLSSQILPQPSMDIFLIKITNDLHIVKTKGEFSVLLLLASQHYWKQLRTPSSFMLSSFGLQNLQSSGFVFLVSLASSSQYLCLVPLLF